ncbi:MAG: TonB-dependent receptor [Cyclobacteriaceae bacterium]|nr:TonB-dependent receptor [Cyclobacteriaceae bacterium]MCH8516023.1 TonB-dependent receptor [Cyclobacteriaceae bacterium]
MKHIYIILLSSLFFLLLCSSISAQTVRGTITDVNKEPLVGVNVQLAGTFVGTTTDVNGEYSIKVEFSKENPTLIISSVGYSRESIALTADQQIYDIVLAEDIILGSEVIISASRVEERVLESPVTVEQVSFKQIENSGNMELFNALGRFKGVDVNSSSMTLTTISTRGFNSPKSERVIQLADYVDIQSPSLNINAGNILGVPELDIETVDIIHGPASALYGANAFNGVILTNSKDPFLYEGLDVRVRGGNRAMMDFQARYAKKITDRLAFKFNATYFEADDFIADNFNPINIDPVSRSRELGDFNTIGFDAVNRYGQLSQNIRMLDGTDVLVFSPGWTEREMIADDNRARTIRFQPVVSYLITDDIKATLDFKYARANATYQSTSRYRYMDFGANQLRAEVEGKDWFVRAFWTEDFGGDTYDMNFLGASMMRMPFNPENPAGPSISNMFFNTYQNAINMGQSPEQAMAAATAMIPGPGEGYGSPEQFTAIRTDRAATPQPLGGLIPANSQMYNLTAQKEYYLNDYQFIVGGQYREFSLFSGGTEDAPGALYGETSAIRNWEYGFYGQVSNRFLNNRLKAQLAVRMDDFQNFDPAVSPRASVVYSVDQARNHNIRAAYGKAFRSPTQLDQYITLDIGRALLLGNIRTGDVSTGFTGYAAGAFTQEVAPLLPGVLTGLVSQDVLNTAAERTVVNFRPLELEEVDTWEVGYKGVFNNKFYVDFTAFYSIYNNFIGATPFIGRTDGTLPSPIEAGLAAATGAIGQPGNEIRAIQVWHNIDQRVQTGGVAIGLNYYFNKKIALLTNYSWNTIQEIEGGFRTFFNTPEHKFNIGLEGEPFKNFNYSVNYKWVQGFLYEFPFDDGFIDDYDMLDASVSYKVPEWKTTFTLGGSNLLNGNNIQIYGGPAITRLVFAGVLLSIN